MSDFLRSLLTAEAHSDPYVWAAVALAHAMIGASLMIFAGLLAAALLGDPVAGLVLVAAGYAGWEVMQTLGGRSLSPARFTALPYSRTSRPTRTARRCGRGLRSSSIKALPVAPGSTTCGGMI